MLSSREGCRMINIRNIANLLKICRLKILVKSPFDLQSPVTHILSSTFEFLQPSPNCLLIYVRRVIRRVITGQALFLWPSLHIRAPSVDARDKFVVVVYYG